MLLAEWVMSFFMLVVYVHRNWQTELRFHLTLWHSSRTFRAMCIQWLSFRQPLPPAIVRASLPRHTARASRKPTFGR